MRAIEIIWIVIFMAERPKYSSETTIFSIERVDLYRECSVDYFFLVPIALSARICQNKRTQKKFGSASR